MQAILLDSIQKYVESLNDPRIFEDSYTRSYPAMTSYFADKNTLTKDQLIVGAHAIYGWMPKIIRLNLDDTDVELLNQVKEDVLLNEIQLEKLKISISNSIIGVSKLLHFINPASYPIYDTHLYRFLHRNTKNHQGHFYQVNKVDVYQEYMSKMRTASSTETGKNIGDMISDKIRYKVTPMRAIELSMFYMHKTDPFI